MGVTIHFSGQLKNKKYLDVIIKLAKNYASKNKWMYEFINEKLKKLERVKNEKDWDYIGPTKGIAIYPKGLCEPVYLEFDKNGYIQEYCKTQFAGIGVHIKVIKLLRSIEPYFDKLEVIDEGEYWDSKDEVSLKEWFDSFFRALDKEKKKLNQKKVNYQSPSVVNKRIFDIISG
jgi:hypothetical protein